MKCRNFLLSLVVAIPMATGCMAEVEDGEALGSQTDALTAQSELPYLDLSVDRVDPNAISDEEEAELLDQGFIAITIKKKIPLTIQFMHPNGQSYSRTGIVPFGSRALVHPGSGEGYMDICRNNIESDWRTLVKINK